MFIQAIALFALLLPVTGESRPAPRGSSIADTPHNFSVSGIGYPDKRLPIYQSKKEERVCVFCHSPHHAFSDGPLWSREIDTNALYTPYFSTTLNPKHLRPDQPLGASRLCLSCHDGTIAIGKLTRSFSLDEAMPAAATYTAPSININLGRNLADDHPISFPYFYEPGGELEDPELLPAKGIRLSPGNFLECTGCHNPHDNSNDNFLVINNIPEENPGTPLCIACHRKAGWDDKDSVHSTGGGDAFNGPLVKAQGCANCHLPHSAPGVVHLLKSAVPSATCANPVESGGSCHNGLKNDGDILSLTKKSYRHSVLGGANDDHVETEVLPARVKHVECVDCHNPHQSGAEGVPLGAGNPAVMPASQAPAVNGALRGVRGVDQSGTAELTPATAEYQICFKCHASTNAVFKAFIVHPLRQSEQFDQSLRFSSDNASYHPVVGVRKKNGNSLLLKYTNSMKQIYCCDCHSPMGSDEAHLLRGRNWETYPSIEVDYPLCFRCHDSEYLTNPTLGSHAPSAAFHKSHLFNHTGANPPTGGNAPCSSCHDPHGVANNLFLVNFDLRYAGSTPLYNGATCTVACHGANPKNINSYP